MKIVQSCGQEKKLLTVKELSPGSAFEVNSHTYLKCSDDRCVSLVSGRIFSDNDFNNAVITPLPNAALVREHKA